MVRRLIPGGSCMGAGTGRIRLLPTPIPIEEPRSERPRPAARQVGRGDLGRVRRQDSGFFEAASLPSPRSPVPTQRSWPRRLTDCRHGHAWRTRTRSLLTRPHTTASNGSATSPNTRAGRCRGDRPCTGRDEGPGLCGGDSRDTGGWSADCGALGDADVRCSGAWSQCCAVSCRNPFSSSANACSASATAPA